MHLIHKDDDWFVTKLGIKLSANTGPWVAGGAALAWFLGRPTNSDIDLYFKSNTNLLFFKTQLESKMRGVQTETKSNEWLAQPEDYPFTTHETPNAISYDVNDGVSMNNLGKLQLIRRNFYSDPQSCIEDFDISICQIATDGDKIWVGEHTLHDIENRQFRFTKNIGPSSARRFIKYHAYGFRAIDSAYDQLFAAENVGWVRVAGMDDYA